MDGVLYSCDFSDKTGPKDIQDGNSLSTPLTLDDITALGTGRRAERAKERLKSARKSLEEKEHARRAIEGALMLSVPLSVRDESMLVEEMSKEGLMTRMSLKRAAENSSLVSSVVSIPLAKTRKIGSDLLLQPQQKNNTKKNNKKEANTTKNGAKQILTDVAFQQRLSKSIQHKNTKTVKTMPDRLTNTTVKVEPLDSVSLNEEKKMTPTGVFSTLNTQIPQPPCLCKRSASSLVGNSGKGWEGTATLYHGSRLRFGCLHFVLSVAGRPGHIDLVKSVLELTDSVRTD